MPGIEKMISITNVPATAELRRGSWVLDATHTYDSNTRAPILRNAEFYRVVSVTPVGATLTLEVHKPVVRSDGATGPAYGGTLISIPAITEVFERPWLTAGSGP